MTVADLETLLRDAREFNMVKGVTGALLHNGKNFMQCFEGPDQGVLEVYRKIKASRQHCDLVEYFNEPTPQRSFGSWSMSSTLQAQSQALSLSRAQWDQARQTAVFPPPHSPGLGMLEVFWGLSKLS
jgi:hypothetical protein